jgi:hypothetical protein
MKNLTNKILIVNVILGLIIFLIAFFQTELGLTDHDYYYLALLLVIVFGMSIGGFFAGIIEHKYDVGKTTIGILGNIFLVVLFLSIFIIAIESN